MKDEKLERFFDAINFDINLRNYFSESIVNEVLLNKKINMMTICFTMEETMHIEIYKYSLLYFLSRLLLQ